jgi:hypothetical protein
MMSEAEVRKIAREEAEKAVASLSGLVMKRAQEIQLTRSGERNAASEIVREELSQIFGEALQQFSDDKWPGEDKV